METESGGWLLPLPQSLYTLVQFRFRHAQGRVTSRYMYGAGVAVLASDVQITKGTAVLRF